MWWGAHRETICESLVAHATAAIAQPVQPATPEGYVLVPIEPTVDMVAAMAVEPATGRCNKSATVGMAGAERAYGAMLVAASKSVQPPPAAHTPGPPAQIADASEKTPCLDGVRPI